MFLTANEVADYMCISVPMAYKIIRKLNDELKEKGYLTVCGKVSRLYFESRVYNPTSSNNQEVSHAGV